MRILVAYASRSGGTEGIARIIAEELSAHGHRVDCVPVDRVRTLLGFDAVVLGSAIYYGRWRREALRFVARHGPELKLRPLWLFDSGPLDDSADVGTVRSARGVDAIATRLGARGHATFGGRLEAASAGVLLRRLMAGGRAGSFGDHRDPERVRRWARSVDEELGSIPGPVAPAAVPRPEPAQPALPAETELRAGRIALWLGLGGIVLGILGAATFVPYSGFMGPGYGHLAWTMTGFSLVGAAASGAMVVTARHLTEGRPGARRRVLAVVAVLALLLVAMASLYPVTIFLLVFFVLAYAAVAYPLLRRGSGSEGARGGVGA